MSRHECDCGALISITETHFCRQPADTTTGDRDLMIGARRANFAAIPHKPADAGERRTVTLRQLEELVAVPPHDHRDGACAVCGNPHAHDQGCWLGNLIGQPADAGTPTQDQVNRAIELVAREVTGQRPEMPGTERAYPAGREA